MGFWSNLSKTIDFAFDTIDGARKDNPAQGIHNLLKNNRLKKEEEERRKEAERLQTRIRKSMEEEAEITQKIIELEKTIAEEEEDYFRNNYSADQWRQRYLEHLEIKIKKAQLDAARKPTSANDEVVSMLADKLDGISNDIKQSRDVNVTLHRGIGL